MLVPSGFAVVLASLSAFSVAVSSLEAMMVLCSITEPASSTVLLSALLHAPRHTQSIMLIKTAINFLIKKHPFPILDRGVVLVFNSTLSICPKAEVIVAGIPTYDIARRVTRRLSPAPSSNTVMAVA